MLADDKVKEYERTLEEEKRKLLAAMEKDRKPADFGSDTEGNTFDEEADEAEEFTNQLATNEAYKERVNEIDGALNRIRKGEYGTCEKCKGAISEAVLAIAPESALCGNCKKEEE